MSAPSPLQLSESLASFTITANGKPLDNMWQVISIDVRSGVNRLPRARIAIADGSATDATFAISEASALIPGAALTIALGYQDSDALVFSGVIDRQSLERGSDGPSQLIVEATDPAMAMTLTRRNKLFERMTDSAMIEQIIATAGLTASVTKTKVVEEAIVQYHASDWDLMLARAEMNGMVVTVSGGKVVVAPPDTSQAPVLSLAYGESILDFRTTMDAATQYTASAMQSAAWNPDIQAVTMSGSSSSAVTTPGNISSDSLASVFGIDQLRQQTSATLDQADLTAWSSARLTKARLAKIRGRFRFQGSALAQPGCMITLAGLGSRFNGNAYVSGVHHQVVEGAWTTETEVGLSPQWGAGDTTENRLAADSAAGQIPAVSNLQIGIVTKIDDDPGGEYRVQITLPLLQASPGVWARLGGFYASNSAGAMFYPEIGDEVVVAFMNGDPRCPVITGSLYSKANPPPLPPTASNDQKAIVTHGKLRIDFFDKTGALEISTPGGRSLRFDDKAGTVTVKDASGNTVTMDKSGISIDSSTRISLTTKSDISMTAQGKLLLKGTHGVAIDGPVIPAKAATNINPQSPAKRG